MNDKVRRKTAAVDEDAVCSRCGRIFVRRSVHETLCEDCKIERTRESKRAWKRRAREEKRSSRRKSGKMTIAEKKAMIGHGICPYCGRMARKGQTFCPVCLEERFDSVYEMFHKSNGWDEEKKERVEVRPGWRGRKVIGAYSASGRKTE